jgi:MYXO-CTERM domain-containing protein
MRDVYWLLSGYVHTFSSYDPDADAWTEHGTPNPGNNGIDGAGVVDPVRDLYIYVDALETGNLYAMPLAGPYDAWTELTVTGDLEIQSSAKLGMEWEPLSERMVAWNDGADVYVLNPPDGDPLTGEWVWARVPPDPANTTVPTRNSNGTYSRFRYAATVNAFVLVSSTGGPVWAYRLTPGTGTGPMPRPDAGVEPGRDGGSTSSDGGAPEDAGDDGGCGCRVAAPGTGLPLALLGAVGLVAVLVRRRRR